jgi:hypothetical protein
MQCAVPSINALAQSCNDGSTRGGTNSNPQFLLSNVRRVTKELPARTANRLFFSSNGEVTGFVEIPAI